MKDSSNLLNSKNDRSFSKVSQLKSFKIDSVDCTFFTIQNLVKFLNCQYERQFPGIIRIKGRQAEDNNLNSLKHYKRQI